MADRINQRLRDWKEKYESALSFYADDRNNFRLWQKQFEGDKEIPGGAARHQRL